jgi:hypothetical protein
MGYLPGQAFFAGQMVRLRFASLTMTNPVKAGVAKIGYISYLSCC